MYNPPQGFSITWCKGHFSPKCTIWGKEYSAPTPIITLCWPNHNGVVLTDGLVLSGARPSPLTAHVDGLRLPRASRGRNGRAIRDAREWHLAFVGCRAPCLCNEPTAPAPPHSTPAPTARCVGRDRGFPVLCSEPDGIMNGPNERNSSQRPPGRGVDMMASSPVRPVSGCPTRHPVVGVGPGMPSSSAGAEHS